MVLNPDACFRAVRARDGRFDGRFYVAVSSTGIYCRPICPVRPPKRENMRFYPSAAAAEGAGFRPCLRCRPERAPGIATVDAVSRLVRAAVAGIEEHALSSASVSDLARSLGVSDRHLRRVTESQLGVSPIALAQTQRLLLAKRLLGETNLSITDIAMASGFNSVRRFNALFKTRYGLNPRNLRGRSGRRNPPVRDARQRRASSARGNDSRGRSDPSAQGESGGGLHCQLDFRPPFAWEHLLAYKRLRAIPNVEMTTATHYRRTVAIDRHQGWISVTLTKNGTALDVELAPTLAPVIGAVLSRVKHQFDLGADPHAVSSLLEGDRMLGAIVRAIPGLRVAGAFDGYELAVRAVLGQQVSVKSATTTSGRWANAFGAAIETPFAELSRLSPTAQTMATLGPDDICVHGIIGARARSMVELARAVIERRVLLSYAADVDAQIDALLALPGIGPWTAQYIAMRALQWPDAFPSGDLMLLRAAKLDRKQLERHAERWRPWRAYATHYLWQSQGATP